MAYEYTDIIVEKPYPIGYITINRPERRNALAPSTVAQLNQAFIEMREDHKIRVFVIRGNGDCFCSGFDLSRFDEGIFRPPDEVPSELDWITPVQGEPWARIARDKEHRLINPESKSLAMTHTPFGDSLWDNPKPCIVQIHSFCLGAGLWMTNECDIAYATPDAIFAYPPPRYGSSVVLGILPPWIMGRKKSMEMAFTGKAIDAEEAYNYQIINRIVPRDKIDEEVRKLAESIARIPPMTNLFSKRAINNYYEGLGLRGANRYGEALMDMMEQSHVPGHYLELFENVRTKGLREALRLQRENWGYPDEVMEREQERLRKEKGG